MNRFDFQKGKHVFSFDYENVRELINHLVDVADSDESNIDLMDVFALVRLISGQETKIKSTKEKS